MRKGLAILAICLAVLAVTVLIFVLGYQFSISTSYGLWWLNIIGSLTGIKSTLGQWIVATVFDGVAGVLIFVIVYKGHYGKEKQEEGDKIYEQT